MSIWRLPDSRLATSGSGENEIPEIAVVHEDMFRAFTLASGSGYPVAYRSDTRTMAEVETAGGFFPRKTVLEKFESVTVQVKDVDTEHLRLRTVKADLLKAATGSDLDKAAKVTAALKRMVAIRIGNVDLDTDCAVCVTRDYKIAGLFPYDPQKLSVLDTPARVYVVRMKGWLETYKVQDYLAKQLAYSKEVACLGVPYDDVLGCVVVTRTLDDKTVTLEITGTELRPGATKADFDAIVKGLPAKTTVGVPAMKDDSLKMSAGDKYAHIKAALEGLTGRADPKTFARDRNVVTAGKPTELDAYTPPKPKKDIMV